MSTTLNASTSTGLVSTADTSGTLELQSNGTTQLTVASTGAYGTLKSGTAVSASGTSVDFTSIPSWAKRITVLFQGVSTNGSSIIQLQLGTSGGIQTTSYTSGAWIANTTNSNSTTGLIISGANSLSYSIDAIMNLCLLDSATGKWVFSSVMSGSSSGINAIGGGSKTLSGTLDRVRITTVNGTDTFDAGSINIIYEG